MKLEQKTSFFILKIFNSETQSKTTKQEIKINVNLN